MVFCTLMAAACGPERDPNLATDRGLGEEVKPQAIVGGNPTSPDEYPHQVSLQDRSGFHFCGGSLIGDNWVLTAAHCITRPASSLQVEVGMYRMSQGGEVFRVAETIVHPNYNASTNRNDLALVRLAGSAANYTSVPLVDADAEGGIASPGTLATVSGWGTLSSGGSSPDVLMSVDVPIVSNNQCDSAYSGVNITSDMLCAGYLGTGGRDSCQGDSGGPLVVDSGNGNALVGVVSWGYSCASPNYPGVYARVSQFESWISSYVPDVQYVSDAAGGGNPDPGPGPGPAPTPTDDHGDDFNSATTVDVNGSASLTATLDPGDVDVFRLELNGATEVTVTTTGNTDTYGTLYNTSGSQVAADDDSGAGYNFQITRSNADGAYYIAVRGYDANTNGSYTLSVTATGSAPPPPAPVGGETLVNIDASGGNDSATLSATLDAGATDVYRIEVANAAVYLGAGTSGSTDTYGTLTDAAGNIIAQNDDANASVSYNFGLGANVQPGTYFLEVRGYSGSTTGAYELIIDASL